MRERVLNGRYRLGDLLGSGGMGEVWRARDEDLHRTVAVKLFDPPPDLAEDDRSDLLARFRQEARAVAALSSPYVVTVHDHGLDEGGLPYLVMELVDGRSIQQLLREHGPQPLDRVLGWAEQICRALETAHAAGLVHRDIKPGNVMVAVGPDGADRVKVLDFGIAKFLEGAEAASRLTRTGQMPMGSFHYMAPEQFRMEEGDGRTDLYALGCVLYELLVGRQPFTGPAAGVMYHHLHDTPLLPSRARSQLTPALDRLILSLMAKNPADRPRDAAAALTEVQALRLGLVPRGASAETAADGSDTRRS
ncbi:protein kinase, partial [Streptomyces sp. NPDC060194]|uniref:protein kinase domain-containing protein n=1 Tax=Streptomyces sp. NPDC060194 TaxID=3347069 RepID=UPI003646BA2A